MTEWQSIESAPKNGSLVLAWREAWEEPRFVRWSYNYRTKTAFWNDDIEQDHYENETEPPTHWIKLPPVPTPHMI